MSVNKISEINIDEYRKLLPKLACENVVRSCYRGVAANGKDGVAIMIWEMVNDPKTGEKRADVWYIVAKDAKAFKEVFKSFRHHVDERSVTIAFEVRNSVSKIAKDHLKEEGFTLTRGEGRDVVISVDDLVNVTSKYRRDVPGYTKSLGELNLGELGRVIRKCLYCGTYGTIYDLENINMNYFERNVSCCLYYEGEVLGAFLLHKNVEGVLEVCLLAGFSEDPAYIMYMLCYTAMAAEKFYPYDTNIVIRRYNNAMSELVTILFPYAKSIPVTKGGKAVKKKK